MDDIERIKSGIEQLYSDGTEVHISIKLSRPKVSVEGAPATITGVYRNIFQIEKKGGTRPARYTFGYGDVLIGHVVIAELGYSPKAKPSGKK